MNNPKFKIGDTVWYYDNPHVLKSVIKDVLIEHDLYYYSLDLYYEVINETIDVCIWESRLYPSKEELIQDIVKTNEQEIEERINENKELFNLLGHEYDYCKCV